VSSDLDVIKAIVDAFEQSDWAEIDVRSGSLRIRLSTQPLFDADAAPPIPHRASVSTTGSDPDGDPGAVDSAAAAPTTAAVIPPGAHPVISPSPGIFWRSPQPGAPPFADLGDEVEAGGTLAIVEVMKLMNHIGSGISGTVVGVYVENGMRVDRGDALFAIQPSTSP
jgi:biotin carboxyl carrier protein